MASLPEGIEISARCELDPALVRSLLVSPTPAQVTLWLDGVDPQELMSRMVEHENRLEFHFTCGPDTYVLMGAIKEIGFDLGRLRLVVEGVWK